MGQPVPLEDLPVSMGGRIVPPDDMPDPQPSWGEVLSDIPGQARAGLVAGIAGVELYGARKINESIKETGLQVMEAKRAEDRARGVISETGIDMAPTPGASLLQSGVQQGLSSLAQQVPWLALGWATRNPELALTGMGVQTTTQKYGELIVAGNTEADAISHALGQGVTEVVTEMGPTGFLLKYGGPVIRHAVGFMIRELPGETIAQLEQGTSDYVAKIQREGGEVTAATYWEGLKQASQQLPETWIATLVGGGTQVGLAAGANRLAGRKPEEPKVSPTDRQRFKDTLSGAVVPPDDLPPPPGAPPVAAPEVPGVRPGNLADVVNRPVLSEGAGQIVPPSDLPEAAAPVAATPITPPVEAPAQAPIAAVPVEAPVSAVAEGKPGYIPVEVRSGLEPPQPAAAEITDTEIENHVRKAIISAGKNGVSEADILRKYKITDDALIDRYSMAIERLTPEDKQGNITGDFEVVKEAFPKIKFRSRTALVPVVQKPAVKVKQPAKTKLRGKRPPSDPSTMNVLEFLSTHKIGQWFGVNWDEAVAQGLDPADLKTARGVGWFRPFVKGGASFDAVAEALHEAGYPVTETIGGKTNYSVNKVLEVLDRAIRGEAIYSQNSTGGFERDAADRDFNNAQMDETRAKLPAAMKAVMPEQDQKDFDYIAYANAIDEGIVEGLARKHENDDAAFWKELKETVDARRKNPPTHLFSKTSGTQTGKDLLGNDAEIQAGLSKKNAKVDRKLGKGRERVPPEAGGRGDLFGEPAAIEAEKEKAKQTDIEDKTGAQIEFVDNEAQLPEELKLLGTGVLGTVNLATGKIILIRKNIAKEARHTGETIEQITKRVIAHELVGHLGMFRILGERWNTMLETIPKLAKSDGAIKAAWDYVNNTYAGESPETLAAETIARLAEQNPQHSFVKRLVAMIREGLRKLGFTVEFSHNDIVALLNRAAVHTRYGAEVRSATVMENGRLAMRGGPIWLSGLEQIVTSAKLSKGTAEQWIGYLDNNGAKSEEMKWTGVADWLREQKGPVTKEVLADYVRANKIDLQEVVLGEPQQARAELPKDATIWKVPKEPTDPDSVTRWVVEIANPRPQTGSVQYFGSTKEEAIDNALQRVPVTKTNFPDRVLPGGENYRELLLTLPVPELTPEIAARRAAFKAELETVRLRTGRIRGDRGTEAYNEGLAELRKKYGVPEGQSWVDHLAAPAFRGSHFDQPNVLAHVRFNDRTDVDGKKTLFIEEIQSDWAQTGRRQGFTQETSAPAITAEERIALERVARAKTLLARQVLISNDNLGFDSTQEALDAIRSHPDWAERWSVPHADDRAKLEEFRTAWEVAVTANRYVPGQIPSAPFVTKTEGWAGLAMKRMIRWAAEHGYDQIAWTPGEVQADRYDLSKRVRKVVVMPVSGTSTTSRYILSAYDWSDQSHLKPILRENVDDLQKLDDIIGKEVGERARKQIAEKGNATLEQLDLKVGGEGMRGFYDSILVSIANKLGKRFGARVATTKVGGVGYTGNDFTDAHSLPITPAMRESVMRGQTMFAARPTGQIGAPGGPVQTQIPDKVEVGGGEYTTKPFRGMPQEVQQVLLQVVELEEGRIEAERGGVDPISWVQEGSEADKLLRGSFGKVFNTLINRIPRAAANAPMLEAYARVVNTAGQVVVTAAKKYSKTFSAEDLLDLINAKEQLGMVLAPFMGYRTEAGRALNVLKKIQGDFAEATALFEALGDFGNESAIRQFAKMIANAKDVGEALRMTKAAYTPSLWDQFLEFWINGLLSGPWTHVVNMSSNLAFNTLETGVELAVSLVSRNVRTRSVMARVFGQVAGLQLGMANAIRAFVTEDPQLTGHAQIDTGRRRAIPGRAGRIIRIPGRALIAEDELAKASVFTGELYRLAMDEALKRNPQNPWAEMPGVLKSFAHNREVQQQAKDFAERLTFQTGLGPTGEMATHVLNVSKFGRIIIPFVRTPTNIFKRAIEYTPAAGFMKSVREDIMAGGRRRDMALGRYVIGSSLMLGFASMVISGLVDGAGPDDEAERELWLRLGHQPYSIKNPVTGTRYKFNRFEPLGMLLGIAADIGEISHTATDKELGDVGIMMLSSVALNLGDKTFLRGISDFSQAYSDPKRYFGQWADNMAASLVPNIAAQAARVHDPFAREARGMVDAFQARIPFWREKLPPKLDIAGEPIKRSVVEPISPREARNDPLASTMLELGVFKGKPSRSISHAGRTYELTAQEYNSMVSYVQGTRWRILTQMVQSKRFQVMKQHDSARAAKLLELQYDALGTQAKFRWIARHPEVRRNLRAAPMNVHSQSEFAESQVGQ